MINSKITNTIKNDRMSYAINSIKKLGFIICIENNATISFIFKDRKILMYPFTGWHSGKSIKDGRGIHNLIKQIL